MNSATVGPPGTRVVPTYVQKEIGEANDFISNLKIKSQRQPAGTLKGRVQTAPQSRPDHARKGLQQLQQGIDGNYNHMQV